MSSVDFIEDINEIMEINEFKDLNTYLKSEDNIKRCEPFEKLNQKYILIQKTYGNSFSELSKSVESQVYRREYAKGGKGFHRGVYSPSCMDLVVGNCNRGKLLKRLPKYNNYDYEYLFDIQNSLICVYEYNNHNSASKLATTELFVYKQNIVLSLIYNSNDNHGLSFVSECRYKNGVISRYESALCELFYGGNGCRDISIETYKYYNNLLHSFCYYNYMPSLHSLTQELYTFDRDEEGYLSTYRIKQIGGFKPKTSFDRDSVIFKVNAKRV